MAQGAIKKTAKPTAARAGKTQKKSGVLKQKQAKTSADKLQKKYSAGLVAKTEKLLGERAGHLELLGKSKKGAKGAKTTDTKKQKGGSRKFG